MDEWCKEHAGEDSQELLGHTQPRPRSGIANHVPRFFGSVMKKSIIFGSYPIFLGSNPSRPTSLAGVAQLAAQRFCKPMVEGSSPFTGPISTSCHSLWAVSDNGSTRHLQCRGRGSTPLRSTSDVPSLWRNGSVPPLHGGGPGSTPGRDTVCLHGLTGHGIRLLTERMGVRVPLETRMEGARHPLT